MNCCVDIFVPGRGWELGTVEEVELAANPDSPVLKISLIDGGKLFCKVDVGALSSLGD